MGLLHPEHGEVGEVVMEASGPKRRASEGRSVNQNPAAA
jgi:hypothetical protein